MKTYPLPCVAATFLFACVSPPDETAPGAGGQGGGSVSASASSGCPPQVTSSSSASSASASSGGAPVSCLPCNAKLDDPSIKIEALCDESQAIWNAAVDCACDYSLTKITECAPKPADSCPFVSAPKDGVCNFVTKWYCQAAFDQCARDWSTVYR